MKFGDPRLSPKFWERTRESPSSFYGGTPCIEFINKPNNSGFGAFWVEPTDAMPTLVHRYAWTICHGEPPDGWDVRHLCGNRLCGNDDHLECVPQAETPRRGHSPTGQNLRKTHCPQGHEYTADNLTKYSKRRGFRTCRACHTEKSKRRYYRLKHSQVIE